MVILCIEFTLSIGNAKVSRFLSEKVGEKCSLDANLVVVAESNVLFFPTIYGDLMFSGLLNVLSPVKSVVRVSHSKFSANELLFHEFFLHRLVLAGSTTRMYS